MKYANGPGNKWLIVVYRRKNGYCPSLLNGVSVIICAKGQIFTDMKINIEQSFHVPAGVQAFKILAMTARFE